MDSKQIEEIMGSFLRREFDVLVATTIIESGMDIPNVNTILVERRCFWTRSTLSIERTHWASRPTGLCIPFPQR